MNLPDFDHLAPKRDKQFVSIGCECQLLQIMPGQLRVLMEQKKIKFAQVVDGVGYLTISDAERIAAYCRDVRAEIDKAAAKCDAAPNN